MVAVLTAVVIVLHLVFSVGLVALILLHSGRGGGLSEAFGGGMSSGALGGSTVMERNLNRITVMVGLAFAGTTIGLTWLLAA